MIDYLDFRKYELTTAVNCLGTYIVMGLHWCFDDILYRGYEQNVCARI